MQRLGRTARHTKDKLRGIFLELTMEYKVIQFIAGRGSIATREIIEYARNAGFDLVLLQVKSRMSLITKSHVDTAEFSMEETRANLLERRL